MRSEDYYFNDVSLEEVRNVNEIQVIEGMKEMVGGFSDFCGCQICVEDVYAATLNQLPAKYKQNIIIVDPQDVISKKHLKKILKESFKRVISNPRHV